MRDVDLSIIVPAYNVEEYIEECIDSILKQNLTKFEILVINDGSSDRTLNKLEKYKVNEKIKIITTENKGLSAARNLGIKLSKGEYILLLDSDDFLIESTLSKILMEAKINKLEMIAYNCNIYYSRNNYFRLERPNYTEEIIDGIEFSRINYINKKSYPMSWLNLYHRNIFMKYNLLFKEGIIYEDVEFNIRLMINVKRMKYLNLEVINYRQRSNSITKSKRDFKLEERSYYNIISTYKKVEEICERLPKEYYKNTIGYYTKNLVLVYLKNRKIAELKRNYNKLKENLKMCNIIKYKCFLILLVIIKYFWYKNDKNTI